MRMVCNTCHRELPCDSSGTSRAATEHRATTGHLNYHYKPDLDERHAMDAQYGTTCGTRAKEGIYE